jgi:chaperonin GroES
MNIEPLQNNVIIKAFEKKEKVTKSGLILVQDSDNQKVEQGEVVAVGPGKMNDQTGNRFEMSVKVGNMVLFEGEKYNLKTVEVNGEDCVLMNEDQILGIVRN